MIIAIVEDDKFFAERLRRFLAEANRDFESFVCGDLETAKQKIRDVSPDAVALDLNLPDSSGVDTFIQLHKSYPGIPIIIISGEANENLAFKAVKIGAQDYLVKKHLTPQLLYRSLKYAIERRKEREETERSIRNQNKKLALKNDELAALNVRLENEIRARELAEKRLKERSDLLNKVTRTAPILFFVFDIETKSVTWCAKSILIDYGYSPVEIDEIDDSSLHKLLGNKELVDLLEAEEFDRKNFGIDYVFEIQTPLGVRYLNARIAPFAYSDRGALKSVLFAGVDDTKTVLARIEKDKVEQRMQRFVDESYDGMLLSDEKGKIILWSKGLEKITNISAEKMLGRYFWEVRSFFPNFRADYDGAVDYRDLYKKALESGDFPFEGYIIQLEVKNPSGEIKYGDASIFMLDFDGGYSFGGIIRDVTRFVEERKEREKLIEELRISRESIEEEARKYIELNDKLERSEAELIEINANKDKFMSLIAHDLRSPLSSFIGLTKNLVEDFDDISINDIFEISKALKDSSENLYRLLMNLLDWTRSQTGRFNISMRKINLIDTCKGNLNHYKSLAKEKGIELTCNIDSSAEVHADGNALEAIMRNFITNAVKFTRPGGKIEVFSRDEGDRIALGVKDDGVGMPPEKAASLFDVKSADSTVGTADEKGSGLGLLLCKELSEKMNSPIKVESSPGAGSIFTLTLGKSADE